MQCILLEKPVAVTDPLNLSLEDYIKNLNSFIIVITRFCCSPSLRSDSRSTCQDVFDIVRVINFCISVGFTLYFQQLGLIEQQTSQTLLDRVSIRTCTWRFFEKIKFSKISARLWGLNENVLLFLSSATNNYAIRLEPLVVRCILDVGWFWGKWRKLGIKKKLLAIPKANP